MMGGASISRSGIYRDRHMPDVVLLYIAVCFNKLHNLLLFSAKPLLSN